MPTPTTPHLKLVFFSSKSCGICQNFKRNVLPLLKKDLPDLDIEEVQAAMEGEKVKDPKNEARADAFDVTGFPSFRFEVVGFPEGGGINSTLSGIKKLIEEAQGVLKKVVEGLP